MRALIVFPDWGPFPLDYRRRLPVLGPIQMAACLPEGWEIRYCDARVESVPEEDDFDLVLIGCMTNQVGGARAAARPFRERGIPVVAGGLHPTLLPEECRDFADTVVIGEAEDSLPRLVEDLRAGRLQPLYSCDEFVTPERIPRPLRRLNKGKGHLPVEFLQTSRGCPLNCEFCNVPGVAGSSLRSRDLDDVMDEIAGCREHLFFVDDNLLLDRRRATGLLERLAEVPHQWTGLAPLVLARDRELLRLMERSGCWLLYLDMGPWLTAELCGATDGTRITDQYGRQIEALRDHGIKLIGSFVFGYDHDTPDVFDRTVAFARDCGLEEAEFLISTPYPHTRLHQRLEEEGRLLSKDYGLYTTTHVVFQPRGMTPDQLEEGWRRAYRDFYGDRCRVGDHGFPQVETLAAFPDQEPEDLGY